MLYSNTSLMKPLSQTLSLGSAAWRFGLQIFWKLKFKNYIQMQIHIHVWEKQSLPYPHHTLVHAASLGDLTAFAINSWVIRALAEDKILKKLPQLPLSFPDCIHLGDIFYSHGFLNAYLIVKCARVAYCF